MNKENNVRVHPNDILSPLYEILGEGTEHVDAFINSVGYEWRTWCNNKSIVTTLISQPLINYRKTLNTEEEIQLKRTIQYLLNIDEHAPYEVWSHFPELKTKSSSVGARLFSTYQDTIAPYDWYALCEWMWEILYGSEDWRTNLSSWIVSEKSFLYTKY
jgi:hypothetical protein